MFDLGLEILGNFGKITEMLRIDSEYPADHWKDKFWQLRYKNRERGKLAKNQL